MCECRQKIEEKLTNRFKEECIEATDHSVTLDGYTIVIAENSLMTKGYMQYKTTAKFPLKNGGSKVKKSMGNMIFSYCPFCGVKY